MMLLDTDVLVDIALDRHPYSGPAAELLDRIEHASKIAYLAKMAEAAAMTAGRVHSR